jgi:protein arginine kinase activator
MKCDFCDSKATVFLTQMVEGQTQKVCLCEKCAQERGVTDPTGFSLADLLLSGLSAAAKAAQSGEASHRPGASGKQCPVCGFRLEDLQQVRRFGCAECYNAFRDEVVPLLRNMHRGSTHVGKVPEGLVALQVKTQRIKDLRARLEQAIAAENYEEAAGIRDEILSLSS